MRKQAPRGLLTWQLAKKREEPGTDSGARPRQLSIPPAPAGKTSPSPGSPRISGFLYGRPPATPPGPKRALSSPSSAGRGGAEASAQRGPGLDPQRLEEQPPAGPSAAEGGSSCSQMLLPEWPPPRGTPGSGPSPVKSPAATLTCLSHWGAQYWSQLCPLPVPLAPEKPCRRRRAGLASVGLWRRNLSLGSSAAGRHGRCTPEVAEVLGRASWQWC